MVSRLWEGSWAGTRQRVQRSSPADSSDNLETAATRQSRQAEAAWVVVAFLAAIAVLVTRRPDAILHPQFWAEDGTVFYAQAYNHPSIGQIFAPSAGYLQLLPRFVALAAQLFPLSWGPAIFAFVGIAVQGAPAALLVSRRLENVIPDRRLRIAAGLLYLALPARPRWTSPW
jgi:hypothetical protein